MTCIFTEPRAFRSGREPNEVPCAGGFDETRILDFSKPIFRSLIEQVSAAEEESLERLRVAHGLIEQRIRPVYALSERQRASRTLALGRGSCSQRMAVLEAVARGCGISTRVRGLLVGGEFWKPRFPALSPILPRTVLLAWPDFSLPSGWVDISELFDGDTSGAPFVNAGSETLFEALGRGAVDWRDSSCACAGGGSKLSDYIVKDLGQFDSRDALFDEFGENLAAPLRYVAGPILERVRAS